MCTSFYLSLFPLSNSLTCHFQVKPNLFFLSPSLYTSFIKMAGNTQKCLSVCYFAKWRFANGDTWVPLKTKVFISFLHTHNFNIHPFDSPNLPFLPTSHCSNKKLLGTTYTSFFCVKKYKKQTQSSCNSFFCVGPCSHLPRRQLRKRKEIKVGWLVIL